MIKICISFQSLVKTLVNNLIRCVDDNIFYISLNWDDGDFGNIENEALKCWTFHSYKNCLFQNVSKCIFIREWVTTNMSWCCLKTLGVGVLWWSSLVLNWSIKLLIDWQVPNIIFIWIKMQSLHEGLLFKMILLHYQPNEKQSKCQSLIWSFNWSYQICNMNKSPTCGG